MNSHHSVDLSQDELTLGAAGRRWFLALTAVGVDSDYTFMMAELGKTNMQFQVLSRAGKRVDGGILPLAPDPPAAQSRTQ